MNGLIAQVTSYHITILEFSELLRIDHLSLIFIEAICMHIYLIV